MSRYPGVLLESRCGCGRLSVPPGCGESFLSVWQALSLKRSPSRQSTPGPVGALGGRSHPPTGRRTLNRALFGAAVEARLMGAGAVCSPELGLCGSLVLDWEIFVLPPEARGEEGGSWGRTRGFLSVPVAPLLRL